MASAAAVSHTSKSLAPQPAVEPLLCSEEGTIVIARPLHELFYHVIHFKLPSLNLIARSINKLFWMVFQWHLCDKVLLLRPEALYHSLEGKYAQVKSSGIKYSNTFNRLPSPFFCEEDLKEFKKKHPYMLEKALYYRSNPKHEKISYRIEEDPYIVDKWDRTSVAVPSFSQSVTFTPQSLREYFKSAYSLEITDKKTGNSLSDLMKSKRLERISYEQLYSFNPSLIY